MALMRESGSEAKLAKAETSLPRLSVSKSTANKSGAERGDL